MAKKTLQKGELENENYRRCRQSQCGYFLSDGCQKCSVCHAAPFEIKKSCGRCWNCENIPNQLRWGEINSENELKKREPIIIIKQEEQKFVENEIAPLIEEIMR